MEKKINELIDRIAAQDKIIEELRNCQSDFNAKVTEDFEKLNETYTTGFNTLNERQNNLFLNMPRNIPEKEPEEKEEPKITLDDILNG